MHSFEELEVYKSARELRMTVSGLTKKLPAEEKFRLTDQLIRASRSVTANIAEGFGRYHYQENIQFCRMARGSLHEIPEHLNCAHDEKYIGEEVCSALRNQVHHCMKILNGYIAYLVRAKNSGGPQ